MPTARTATASQTHEHRNAHVVDLEGGTNSSAQWGDLDGASQPARSSIASSTPSSATDWEATVARFGEHAAKALMPRTDAQRRADALTAIFARAAAAARRARSNPSPSSTSRSTSTPGPTLMALAEPVPRTPRRAVRGPAIRSSPSSAARRASGELIDPYAALQASLAGHVRFVILDGTGLPIHWGRKRRLFSGAARQAVRFARLSMYHIPDVECVPGAARSITSPSGTPAARHVPTTAARSAADTTDGAPAQLHSPPRPSRPLAHVPTRRQRGLLTDRRRAGGVGLR